MTGAAVSQIIKEMQLSGYIIKETDKDDMRFFKLYLTDKALSSVEKIREKIHSADEFITKTVTAQKEEEIVKILTSLTNTIKEGL
jgi:DNA-binding MarR family transcriptional regulator